MRISGWLSLAAAFLVAADLPAGAAPVDVDVALVLAGDVSGSMTTAVLRLERDGFVAAFRNPQLLRAIQSGALGRVAVTFVEWAGPDEQWIVVPWTIIGDDAAAEAFAGRLAAAPIVKGTQTSLSSGLLFAAWQFASSGTRPTRRAIDVAGNGPNSNGPPLAVVRNAIVAAGITINGLPLPRSGGDKEDGPYAYLFASHEIDLGAYFEDCVIGGPGAFTMPVQDAGGFFTAIRRKLVLEIAGLPARVILAGYTAPAEKTDCAG